MAHYQTLGVSPTASTNEIRRAHRRLAKAYHPDKLRNAPLADVLRAEEKFKEIQQAYEVLTRHRAEYDKQLRSDAPPAAQSPAPRSQPTTHASDRPSPEVVPAPNWPIQRTRILGLTLQTLLRSGGTLLAIGYVALLATNLRNSSGAPWDGPMYFPFRTEQFAGVIRNQSANSSTEFSVIFLESHGALSGCMTADQPGIGGGPLTGRFKSGELSFVVKSASGKITFSGKGRDGDIDGTYRFAPKKGPEQSGTFTLGKVDTEADDEGLTNDDCPTDAALH